MAFKAKVSVEGLEPSTNGLKSQREKNAHFVQKLTKLGGVHWMDKTTSLLDVLRCFLKRCSQHFRVQCTFLTTGVGTKKNCTLKKARNVLSLIALDFTRDSRIMFTRRDRTVFTRHDRSMFTTQRRPVFTTVAESLPRSTRWESEKHGADSHELSERHHLSAEKRRE
jgi:hypothetical protein